MSSSNVDCNLLFGSLALQMDFISRDELIGAIHAWVLDKKKPLGQILVQQGVLELDARALLDALVQRHLELHEGDPKQSLAAVGLPGGVMQDLDHLVDPDVQASLVLLAAITPNGAPQQTKLPMREAGPTGARFEILRPHALGGLGEVFAGAFGAAWREWQGGRLVVRNGFRRALRMTTERASNDGAAEDSRPSVLWSLLNARWLMVIALIYPLSIMPAYVVLLLLRSRGIDLYDAYESFYRPVLWVLRNVEWARRLNDLIEPALRHLAGR
jgi:hypothetical protein